MPKHKSEDFKMSAVEYYLTEDVSQEQVCRIFKCSPRSLMRWVENMMKKVQLKDITDNQQHIKLNKMKLSLYLMKSKKDKTITMEDLLAKIQHKYPNFDITKNT